MGLGEVLGAALGVSGTSEVSLIGEGGAICGLILGEARYPEFPFTNGASFSLLFKTLFCSSSSDKVLFGTKLFFNSEEGVALTMLTFLSGVAPLLTGVDG